MAVHLAVVVPPAGFLEAPGEVGMEVVDGTDLVVVVEHTRFGQHVPEKGKTFLNVFDVLLAAFEQGFLRNLGEITGAGVSRGAGVDDDLRVGQGASLGGWILDII